jgi:penicillin G amidase
VAVGAAFLVLGVGGGGLWVRAWLRASLPLVEGERTLPGLGAPVRIERDAFGVPVVRGRSRGDVARATGFLHAQERFFQMDLLRRRAAGELAELVGKAGLTLDRETRVLQLRSVARRATVALPPVERELLEAYTGGVNAGLRALGAPPFEYGLLRAAPRAWAPEDSLLCALTMFLTLQGELPDRESTLGLMHDVLPPEMFAFLAPRGTEWDAPLEGGPLPPPPMPTAAVLDLRRTPPAAPPPLAGPPVAWLDPFTWGGAGWGVDHGAGATLGRGGSSPLRGGGEERGSMNDPMAFGSNSWAVAGTETVHGGAILANDMHLGLAVPNTWYRASLVFPRGGEQTRVTGVMLPGAPFVVVGSNGHVAWGFTNTQGDWADLVELEPAPGRRDGYLTPEGPRELGRATETIHVKGAADETLEVLSTVWGPVVDVDHRGRRRALAWVPLREGGLNAALFRMEAVRDLDEALALAPEVGIPHQNVLCADATGRIGWTIMGRIPRRVGFEGRLPTSWADGSRRWDGWRRPEEYPRVVDPPGGRLWTANARAVSGRDLAIEGFGGYDLGARARQIRDDLRALDKAGEADMLRIQLDDRAVFLERWRNLLLEVLTPDQVARSPRRAEARHLVEEWGGRASVDSVGYRLVRGFRERAARAALEPLLAPCREADPSFDYLGRRPNRGIRQWEGPLWALVTERPPHLLDPRFPSWGELLLASLDDVLEELTRGGRSLSARTWGERNTVLIQHPLSRVLPVLGRWLDMPREALPGDGNMPRVQYPRAGASERLVVSPGREERGLFHMPCGESGHPLSPHYRDGQEAWARGEPTPFLPGPPVHVLTLRPVG